MTKKLHYVFAAALLAGCAGTVNMPLSTSQADQITGRSLVLVTHEKPSFTAGTAGKGMFAAIGAMAMISEGNEIISTNDVQDPSVHIAEGVAQSLASRYSLTSDPAINLSDTDDIDELIDQYSEGDLILFTQTRGWHFMYFPTDWDNYQVRLNMTLKLIDTHRKSVLAGANCVYSPEYADSDQAPTHDYLLSDNATGLKAELKKAADYCVGKFLSETFA